MSVLFAESPSTAEQVASGYDSSIVVRRWGATWVDFLVLGLSAAGCLAFPDQVRTPVLLLWCLFALAYYPVLEHLFGRTAGKLVCRVRVVDAAGDNPGWGQSIVRTLLRLVEVNPALLGGVPAGIAVLASKKRQRLGDMAAGTFVVRAEDLPLLAHSRLMAPSGAALSDQGVPPVMPGMIPPPPPPPPPGANASTNWLLPTNRSGWAIAAGYLGLFSVLLLPAPFALVAGAVALRQIGGNPRLGGKGRAVFGIVMGVVFSLLLLAIAVSSLIGSK